MTGGGGHAAARRQLRRGVPPFRWQVPARFNIGVACCDRHADGDGRLALIYEAPDGTVERFSFDDLKRLSNRCANALQGLGIGRGDRVGVLLPQRPETAIAHLAIYKLGAVAVPLFVQFGPDALEHRLADSGARALITDGDNLAKVPVRPARPGDDPGGRAATAAGTRCSGRRWSAPATRSRRSIPPPTTRR